MNGQKTEVEVRTRELTVDELDVVAGGRMNMNQFFPQVGNPQGGGGTNNNGSGLADAFTVGIGLLGLGLAL